MSGRCGVHSWYDTPDSCPTCARIERDDLAQWQAERRMISARRVREAEARQRWPELVGTGIPVELNLAPEYPLTHWTYRL